ncbi:hypothetical protein N657DRAFT_72041 [Parathielavia appendiculata]|uniref:Uncharacterized protein n=1 Tax=Parathielavia appendiculata TaxID=2587402 RepID=A0AAN6UB39_9PEZI|nr:hypothetical protein N657DRAFT_72041 [Parathielavia appendiculata]
MSRQHRRQAYRQFAYRHDVLSLSLSLSLSLTHTLSPLFWHPDTISIYRYPLGRLVQFLLPISVSALNSPIPSRNYASDLSLCTAAMHCNAMSSKVIHQARQGQSCSSSSLSGNRTWPARSRQISHRSLNGQASRRPPSFLTVQTVRSR